jgi:hypothetical protein
MRLRFPAIARHVGIHRTRPIAVPLNTLPHHLHPIEIGMSAIPCLRVRRELGDLGVGQTAACESPAPFVSNDTNMPQKALASEVGHGKQVGAGNDRDVCDSKVTHLVRGFLAQLELLEQVALSRTDGIESKLCPDT